MKPDADDRREWTDAQLGEMVRFLARVCLEVERDLRPPQQLAQLMDPTSAIQWRRFRARLGHFHPEPVLAHDLGPPHLTRVGDRTVMAAVATRTEHTRWGALTLHLHCHAGRWQLADVRRLLARTRYRTRGLETEAHRSPADRIRLTAGDRRLAAAALAATCRRLNELTHGDPGYTATRSLVRRWQIKLAELDRELADLHTRQTLRHHLEAISRR